MDPKAALIAAKIMGKMRVVVGLGRLDYVGRFQPFGQTEMDADVFYDSPGNSWLVRVEAARVVYDHPSPRIITHVGMFVYDQWLLDELSGRMKGQTMQKGNVVVFDSYHRLPEEL